MISISIKSRRFPFPWKRTQTFPVPQNWPEITASQLKGIIQLYANEINETALLSKLTGLSRSMLRKMSSYEHYKLMELLEFIGTLRPYHEFIIRKIVPSLFRPPLYAPQSKLTGVSFGQFIYCDSYFSNYQATKNPDELSKFIAALYLEKGEKFSEKLIPDRSRLTASLDETTRQAIFLNYQLMHEWLTEVYPLIFQKIEQLDLFVDDVKSKRNPNNWLKVFQNIVGDDILNDQLWADKPVNTIFAYMSRKYKENMKNKLKH